MPSAPLRGDALEDRRIGIDEQDDPAADRLQFGDRLVDQRHVSIVELAALFRSEGAGASGTSVHCSGRTSRTISKSRSSG